MAHSVPPREPASRSDWGYLIRLWFDTVAEKKVVDEARQARMTAGRGDVWMIPRMIGAARIRSLRGSSVVKGPKALVSGARIAAPFHSSRGGVPDLLREKPCGRGARCRARSGSEALASATGHSLPELVAEIQRRAASFLSGRAKQASALFAFRRGSGCRLGTPAGAERARRLTSQEWSSSRHIKARYRSRTASQRTGCLVQP